MVRLIVATAMLAGALSVLADRADARDDVRVCSRYGHGCVSGPTRKAQFGREVRMPGGTWIHCAGDCAETLREETVDFWEKRQRNMGGRGGRR